MNLNLQNLFNNTKNQQTFEAVRSYSPRETVQIACMLF